MRIGIVGVGAVGTRLARQLVSGDDAVDVALRDERETRVEAVIAALGHHALADHKAYPAPFTGAPVDAVVLAGPAGTHVEVAAAFLRRGTPVISVTDDLDEVRRLLDLDAEARERGVTVAVGAGFSPGLSCVLAKHAAGRLDAVDEIHVAKSGTAGPACARHHHRALGGRSVDWRDGGWVERSGGSGRELCWFPDPIGAQDCYRAALPDALLLVPAFPGVSRVTARVQATRRDRLTARLPMLWPTHPEGGPGGLRVEVRGRQGTRRELVVLGAMDRPAVGAGAVGALVARLAATGGLARTGAAGLAELIDPPSFLDELRRRGVRTAMFEGASPAKT
jgi:hypothetical protein